MVRNFLVEMYFFHKDRLITSGLNVTRQLGHDDILRVAGQTVFVEYLSKEFHCRWWSKMCNEFDRCYNIFCRNDDPSLQWLLGTNRICPCDKKWAGP